MVYGSRGILRFEAKSNQVLMVYSSAAQKLPSISPFRGKIEGKTIE